jgi:hypothetical protein
MLNPSVILYPALHIFLNPLGATTSLTHNVSFGASTSSPHVIIRYKQVVPTTKLVSCKLTTRTCILYLFHATTSIIAHILSLAH